MPRRLARVLGVVASALMLSGCASLHPGEAAVVGDTTITEERLEEFTDGFCTVIAAINQAQGTPTSGVPVRTAVLSALNVLVVGAGADQLAAREGIELGEDEVREWVAGLPPVFEEIPAEDAETVDRVTERVARNSLLVQRLGAQGGPADDPQAAAERGTRRVLSYLEQVGAETDPRYGQVLDTRTSPGTGSLSVPVSSEALQADDVPQQGTRSLTGAQSCS
ncbi:MAG: hypothetical protein M3P83_00760 [Actinomycetota bacterium]|nr:hypothetical protein [Actinomycetota bacterium]